MSENKKRLKEAEEEVKKYKGPMYIGSNEANESRHTMGNMAESDREMYAERVKRDEEAAAGKGRPSHSRKWKE